MWISFILTNLLHYFHFLKLLFHLFMEHIVLTLTLGNTNIYTQDIAMLC